MTLEDASAGGALHLNADVSDGARLQRVDHHPLAGAHLVALQEAEAAAGRPALDT